MRDFGIIWWACKSGGRRWGFVGTAVAVAPKSDILHTNTFTLTQTNINALISCYVSSCTWERQSISAILCAVIRKLYYRIKFNQKNIYTTILHSLMAPPCRPCRSGESDATTTRWIRRETREETKDCADQRVCR